MLGNAATFVISALLLVRLRPPPTAGPMTGRNRYPAGFRDWRFLFFALVNGCPSLHSSMLSIAVPLLTLATRGPRRVVAVLFILNTILAVLLLVSPLRRRPQPGFGEPAPP